MFRNKIQTAVKEKEQSQNLDCGKQKHRIPGTFRAYSFPAERKLCPECGNRSKLNQTRSPFAAHRTLSPV